MYVEKKRNLKKTGNIKSCQNLDGHLGFICPVDKDRWEEFYMTLRLVHLDGDFNNNRSENLKKYCILCYTRKVATFGD